MGWDIEADVDIDDGLRLWPVLLRFFEGAVDAVIVTWEGPGGERRERLSPGRLPAFDPPEGRHACTLRLVPGELGGPVTLLPELFLFGPDHPGYGAVRRRAPAVVSLGPRRAWRGTARLPGGQVLDEAAARSLLLRLCRDAGSRSLRVPGESGVSLGHAERFVFHREPDGFLGDLRDLVRVVLHGGSGFGDARDGYPALREGPDPGMLPGLHPKYRRAVWRALVDRSLELEARGWPAGLDRGALELALAGLDDVDFDEDGEGLAVWGRPFPEGALELFFIGLAEALLGVDPGAGERP